MVGDDLLHHEHPRDEQPHCDAPPRVNIAGRGDVSCCWGPAT